MALLRDWQFCSRAGSRNSQQRIANEVGLGFPISRPVLHAKKVAAFSHRFGYAPERSGSTTDSLVPRSPDPLAIAAAIFPAMAAAAAFTGSLAKCA